MATATSCSFGTIFRFTGDISQLNLQNSIESPEIQLSDVKWKVQLRKKQIDGGGKAVLGVYLVSTFDATNLSCEAQATFKLLGNENQMDRSIVKYLRQQTFNNLKTTHGFDEFIDWDDLLAYFVNDGKANFKVEITAEPVHRLTDANVEQESAKFHVLVKDISQLEFCYSPDIVLRGVTWKVLIRKRDDHLGVFLRPTKSDMSQNWFYKVECTFQLLSLDVNDDGVKRYIRTNFHCELADWGFDEFLQWSDFTSARFTHDDKANFLIDVKVHEPKPLWQLDKPELSNANSSLRCSICLECFTSGNISTIKCGHLFCEPCFTKSIAERQICPTCKVATSAQELHPIFFS